MKNTFALLSIIRTSRHNKDGQLPVYLRITCEGKRTEISTKIYVDPEKWNPEKGRVNGFNNYCRFLNNSIESFEHRAREIYNVFIQKGKIITALAVKQAILNIDDKAHLLVENFELILNEMATLEGLNFAHGTIKNWRVTFNHLKEFVKTKYGVSDIAFRDLELKFVLDFQVYAKTNWQCSTNAALKHIQRIRKVVFEAIANNWIDKDPFMRFKAKQVKSNRTFLTQEELSLIIETPMPLPRLEKVKDIFIFSCYTGLAYVDLEKLTYENLVIGIDKEKWIYTFRTKTGIKSNVPLLPGALAIIEKYKNDVVRINRCRLLPVFTNIKTNAYLKEIADLCGIKKNLTFHMARHTFATTVTLSNGVPIETVSKMLGHTKITTTQIYAKVLENKVSKDMMNLKQKFSSGPPKY